MADDKTADDDYEVGYYKPPKHARFKPGQSGNPRGRPKRQSIPSKDVNALIQAELDKTIPVTEEGRQKRITKREAIVTQLVNQAIKGETKPLQLVLAHLDKHREVEPFVATEDDDAELMRALGMPVGSAGGNGEDGNGKS